MYTADSPSVQFIDDDRQVHSIYLIFVSSSLKKGDMHAIKAFKFSERSRAKSGVLKKLLVDFTVDTTCHGLDQVTRPGRPSSVRYCISEFNICFYLSRI